MVERSGSCWGSWSFWADSLATVSICSVVLVVCSLDCTSEIFQIKYQSIFSEFQWLYGLPFDYCRTWASSCLVVWLWSLPQSLEHLMRKRCGICQSPLHESRPFFFFFKQALCPLIHFSTDAVSQITPNWKSITTGVLSKASLWRVLQSLPETEAREVHCLN